MKKLIAIPLLLVLTVAGASPVPEGGLPPKVILPTRAYNQMIAKAKARYEAELDQARRVYARKLEDAKAEYMRDHDLAGAQAVQDLIDRTQPVESLEGTWRVEYSNRASRVWRFGADGTFEILEAFSTKGRPEGRATGKLNVHPDGETVLELNDGTVLDRITQVGDRILIERFEPVSNYPNRFSVLGRGFRVEN